jgi:hypothetical protein
MITSDKDQVLRMNDEYTMLREEIDYNSKSIHHYFAITCTGIFAILAYILNDTERSYSPHMFSAIFVVLTCVAARVKRLLEINQRISAYMEVFLEPMINGRDWETRGHRQIDGYDRQYAANKTRLGKFSYILLFGTTSSYFTLGAAAYILYIIVLADAAISIWMSIFNTVMLFILLYPTVLSHTNRKKYRDTYLNHWKTIKRQEIMEIEKAVSEKAT